MPLNPSPLVGPYYGFDPEAVDAAICACAAWRDEPAAPPAPPGVDPASLAGTIVTLTPGSLPFGGSGPELWSRPGGSVVLTSRPGSRPAYDVTLSSNPVPPLATLSQTQYDTFLTNRAQYGGNTPYPGLDAPLGPADLAVLNGLLGGDRFRGWLDSNVQAAANEFDFITDVCYAGADEAFPIDTLTYEVTRVRMPVGQQFVRAGALGCSTSTNCCQPVDTVCECDQCPAGVPSTLTLYIPDDPEFAGNDCEDCNYVTTLQHSGECTWISASGACTAYLYFDASFGTWYVEYVAGACTMLYELAGTEFTCCDDNYATFFAVNAECAECGAEPSAVAVGRVVADDTPVEPLTCTNCGSGGSVPGFDPCTIIECAACPGGYAYSQWDLGPEFDDIADNEDADPLCGTCVELALAEGLKYVDACRWETDEYVDLTACGVPGPQKAWTLTYNDENRMILEAADGTLYVSEPGVGCGGTVTLGLVYAPDPAVPVCLLPDVVTLDVPDLGCPPLPTPESTVQCECDPCNTGAGARGAPISWTVVIPDLAESDLCGECPSVAGAVELLFVDGCNWESAETSVCAPGVQPLAKLAMSSGVWTLTIRVSGLGGATYGLTESILQTPLDCFATKTMSLITDDGVCDTAFPATIDVVPIEPTIGNATCTPCLWCRLCRPGDVNDDVVEPDNTPVYWTVTLPAFTMNPAAHPDVSGDYCGPYAAPCPQLDCDLLTGEHVLHDVTTPALIVSNIGDCIWQKKLVMHTQVISGQLVEFGYLMQLAIVEVIEGNINNNTVFFRLFELPGNLVSQVNPAVIFWGYGDWLNSDRCTDVFEHQNYSCNEPDAIVLNDYRLQYPFYFPYLCQPDGWELASCGSYLYAELADPTVLAVRSTDSMLWCATCCNTKLEDVPNKLYVSWSLTPTTDCACYGGDTSLELTLVPPQASSLSAISNQPNLIWQSPVTQFGTCGSSYRVIVFCNTDGTWTVSWRGSGTNCPGIIDAVVVALDCVPIGFTAQIAFNGNICGCSGSVARTVNFVVTE